MKKIYLTIASFALVITAVVFGSTTAYANSSSNLDWYDTDQRSGRIMDDLFSVDNSKYNLKSNDIVKIDFPSGKVYLNNQTIVEGIDEYYSFESLELNLSNVSLDWYDTDQRSGRIMDDLFSVDNSKYNLKSNDIVKIDFPSGKVYLNNQTITNDIDEYYSFESLELLITKPKTRPGISGKDTIINNVDTPYALNDFKSLAGIVVNDDYYGDITNKLVIIDENYTGNERTKGTYQINYSVTNDANLTTTFTLNVVNQDFVAPVITGEPVSTIGYKETMTNAMIIAKYQATDNYDKNLTIKVDSSNYVANVPGVYTYQLSTTDTSGHTTRTTHTLNVIDNVAPTIADANVGIVKFNFKDEITNADLLLNLTATDEIDGNITSKIKVISNPIKKELGIYSVKFEVADAAGNKFEYVRDFEIITTSLPKIYVSSNLISIEDVNTMTIEQLAAVYASYENIEMASFEVLENDYSDNRSKAGNYNLRMRIIDTKGVAHEVSRTIRVFNASEMQPDSVGFFQSIWNFIVKIFKAIYDFVVKIIKGIIGLF